MIKFILKTIIVIILFLYMLIVFLPKENLYYFALEKPIDQKVEITSNKIEDKYIGFSITNSKIKYEKIDVGSIGNIDIRTLLFQTTIDISNFKVQKLLKNFLPYDMRYIKITHNLLNPLVIDIKLSKQFKINNKQIMQYLTKTKNGYRYEYKF
jgi:hypothetical protein